MIAYARIVLASLQRRAAVAGLVILVGSWGCRFEPEGFGDQDSNPGGGSMVSAMCASNPLYQKVMDSAHGYRRVDTPMTYDEAFATCAADGAHLVVIEDSTENARVGDLASNRPGWIGFNDLDVERTFRWVTGSTSEFVAWEVGQPDSRGGEDCATLQSDKEWHDYPCGDLFPFVCECDPGYQAPAPPLVCMSNTRYDDNVLVGRRYRFVTGPTVPWDVARDDCAADGAHLAVINDSEENGRLDGANTGNATLWIGYTDQAAEGQWQWVTESMHPFTNWSGGGPDNGGSGENCAEFRSDGQWNDNECTTLHGYICECDPRVRVTP